MDIPNDLNKLLARLHQVTGQAGRVNETGASGFPPTSAEIDLFLAQHEFDSDTVIEPVEISKDGVFEFYMFVVWHRLSDELSLLAMGAEERWPIDGE
jgi:hypothetical protein